MIDNRRRFLFLEIISGLAFLGVALTSGMFTYWRWFDPILPNIRLVKAEIHERLPPQPGVHDRIYEVLRTLESDDDADLTIHAFFEKMPPADPLVIDGVPVIRDRLIYAIPPVALRIEKGVHQRDRAWEVPAALVPGEYRYSMFLRGCNPIRCRDQHFPPMQVVIPEER